MRVITINFTNIPSGHRLIRLMDIRVQSLIRLKIVWDNSDVSFRKKNGRK